MKLFKDTDIKRVFMVAAGCLMGTLLISIAVVGFTVIWALAT